MIPTIGRFSAVVFAYALEPLYCIGVSRRSYRFLLLFFTIPYNFGVWCLLSSGHRKKRRLQSTHDKKSYGHGSTSFHQRKEYPTYRASCMGFSFSVVGKGQLLTTWVFSNVLAGWWWWCGMGETSGVGLAKMLFFYLGISHSHAGNLFGLGGVGSCVGLIGFVVSWRDGGCNVRPTSVLDLVFIGFASRIWSVQRNAVPGSLEDISRIFCGLVLVWQSIRNWEQACLSLGLLVLFYELGGLGALSNRQDRCVCQDTEL